jgi:enamine deaminase RidA (YjgF/YER057c/UK114 family)
MTRRLISSGSTFERDIGYSRAVVDGDWVFVSGTTGFDYRAMTISDNVVDQVRQCLRNIDEALAGAGAAPSELACATFCREPTISRRAGRLCASTSPT